jgi:hypothetical protein
MPTKTRPAFKMKTYSEQAERFHGRLMEAYYRQLAGLAPDLGVSAIYAEHASLFDRPALDALREAAEADDDSGNQARELYRMALGEHLSAAVAELTERLQAAEAQAVIVWRGERISFRQAWNRAADLSNRGERNALAASFTEAVEALNPLREERHAAMSAAVRDLGFADVPDMVQQTSGIDIEALGAQMRALLAESETVYFAALRRNLAEIDIEQGDGTDVDLERVIRGVQGDRWFEARRMLPTLRATLSGMGIDLAAQRSITVDAESRPAKSPRAFCAPVRTPDDVRLVIQPRGGWDDYAALFHEAGHAEHFAHVDAALPQAYRLFGDNSLTEGYGHLFERLIGNPAWLQEVLGMPEADALAFADFNAFWYLRRLRWMAAQLLYELFLYRTDDVPLARAQYSGMLSLSLGVRVPPERYLLNVDDGLYVARYVRAVMVEGALSTWLRAHHGEAWWSAPSAGEALRRSWRRGQQWNADDVLAHLGYDHLDWRPVLRQIRTLLIGEMSGYGGPNITTRAGTRKV